jgi:hypothetical protein
MLLAPAGTMDLVLRAGLLDADRWDQELAHAAPGPGRGGVARVELDEGRRVVLKKMRRGGWLRGLWGDRYLGRQRLLRNLSVPVEAARRGIATAAPVALLIRGSGSGLFEAWLGVEEIPGATDLLTLLRVHPPSDPAAAAMTFVRRCHDLGLLHRDLNLGNLLARPGAGGWEMFVVDLDRAVLRSGPLGFRARQASLRRLERSHAKGFGRDARSRERSFDRWYELYAGNDASLRRRLASGRPFGRLLLALHRMSWRPARARRA